MSEFRKRCFYVAALWCGAIIISTTYFYFTWWNHPPLPPLWEVLIFHLLPYNFISLPESFVTAFGQTTKSNFMFIGVYWCALLCLHYAFLTFESKQLMWLCFLVLLMVILISSIQWVYVSYGLIGI